MPGCGLFFTEFTQKTAVSFSSYVLYSFILGIFTELVSCILYNRLVYGGGGFT